MLGWSHWDGTGDLAEKYGFVRFLEGLVEISELLALDGDFDSLSNISSSFLMIDLPLYLDH
jgi:hypothetical protein